jgi:hypothetical protein
VITSPCLHKALVVVVEGAAPVVGIEAASAVAAEEAVVVDEVVEEEETEEVDSVVVVIEAVSGVVVEDAEVQPPMKSESSGINHLTPPYGLLLMPCSQRRGRSYDSARRTSHGH